MQNILLIALVIAAAFYIGKRVYNNIRHDGTHTGCAKCDVVKQKKA